MTTSSSRPRVSRSVPSPTSPQGGIAAQLQSTWRRLSALQRKVAVTGLGLILVGSLGFQRYEHSHQPVQLLSARLLARDVQDIGHVLDKASIPFKLNKEGDQILLSEDHLTRARALLREAHLPRAVKVNESSSGHFPTPEELRQRQQSELESTLVNTLREFSNIGDAQVKLAMGKDPLFADAVPNTASVTLHLKPNCDIDASQVSAIVSLVSSSVSGLSPDKVTVVDAGSGRDLTPAMRANLNRRGGSAEFWQAEARYAECLRLQAQQQLDQILGKGRASLMVNCKIDQAEIETRIHAIGDKKELGTQEKTERMQNELKEFESTVNATKFDLARTDTLRVQRDPRLQSISANLFLDNLPEAQAKQISEAVSAGLGIELERGDQFKVANLPFSREMLPAPPPAVVQLPQASAPALPWLPLALVGAGALMVPASLFWLGTRRAGLSRQDLSLAPSQAVAPGADLNYDKLGHGNSKDPRTTLCERPKELEQMAQSQPRDVVAQLRTQWLTNSSHDSQL